MKNLIIVLLILMALIFAWGLMSSNVSITINGQEIEGPLKTLINGWGLVLTTVILFCVAIMLTFILAGVGLFVLGVLTLVGLILAATAFPFLLPLLIPLFIVWAFIVGVRRNKSVEE